uniref:Secreted protein n=1 Tax=Haemonchus contortus TaxID=6289 RepID=A0A7I4Y321_HAECO
CTFPRLFTPMLVVAFLIIVGNVVAQTRPGYQFRACDPIQLQRCQAVFNDDLGIDASLGVLTYQDLRAAIENKLGVLKADGLAKICMSFKYYKTCFSNRNEYANCANNPLGLLVDQNGTATGITEYQALGYTKIFNQFDFSCGAGFSEFANNDECAASVFLTGIDDMRACDNNFAASIKRDPNVMNRCAYLEVAKECYMSAFSKRCSQYPEVVWWGCNYERAGEQTNFPQCDQIFCTYTDPQA